jgi:spermidine synthase
MVQQILPGAAIGLLISLATLFFQQFLPNAAFGPFPAVLGVMPGLAHALFAVRRLLKFSGRTMGYVAAASAATCPAGLFALYYFTGCCSFLSQEASVLNFVLLAALSFLGFGLPLVSAGEARISAAPTPPAVLLPQTLIAASAAFALHQYFAASAGLIYAYLVCLPFLASLTLLYLIPADSIAREPAKTREPAKDRKQTGRPAKETHAKSGFLHMWDYWGRAILSVGLAFWTAFVVRLLMIEALDASVVQALAIPVTAFAFGLGVLTQRRFGNRLSPALSAALPPVLAAASIAYGWRLHESSLFNEIYTAMYTGGGLGALHFEAAFFLAMLPAFFWGASSLPLLPDGNDKGSPYRYLPFPAAVTVGMLKYVAGHDMIGFHALGIVMCALCAALVLPTVLDAIKDRGIAKWSGLGVPAAALLVTVLISSEQIDRFPNIFDPLRFRVASEKMMPAGSAAFLQSRDDDDPGYVTMWNRSKALTQSLTSAQPVLYRMGHLPMLMHPAPQSVLIVGIGSRLAIDAVALHNPRQITCVEPTQALLDLRDQFMFVYSPDTLFKRVRLHTERPEAFFRHNTELQDVIISAEPLASPNVDAAVFTPGYYRSVARSLNEGGVFAQWLPVGSIPESTRKSVMASIMEVFPETEAWLCGLDSESSMLCIMASSKPFGPAQPDRARFTGLLDRKNPPYHMAAIGLGAWHALLADFAMDRKAMQAYAGQATPPSLWTPPSQFHVQSQPDAVGVLLDARSSIPERLFAGTDDSVRLCAKGQFEARPRVLAAMKDIQAGNDNAGVNILFEVLRIQPWQYEARLALYDPLYRKATELTGAKKFQEALAMCNQILHIMPISTGVLRIMMIAALKLNDEETAKLAITGIRVLRSISTFYQDNRASLLAEQGKSEDALMLFQASQALNPLREDTYCNMASLEYSMGRRWEAMHTLDVGIRESYYPARAYYTQGLINLDARRVPLAIESFTNFLRVACPTDPHREEVIKGLAQLGAAKTK